jgi:hypothetical protein
METLRYPKSESPLGIRVEHPQTLVIQNRLQEVPYDFPLSDIEQHHYLGDSFLIPTVMFISWAEKIEREL